ncbi:MAG: DUF262 domain-containing protein [Limisphaerales bacterium]
MKFEHQAWSVKTLVELYDGKRLMLNPPYQRNPIWSAPAQKELISTILRGWPMPSFFLLQRPDGQFEIVDGKQRALTIFAFWRRQLDTSDGKNIDSPHENARVSSIREVFLSYQLSVTRITDLAPDESIEMFYALVNSTGLRLNRPEIRKAEFYTTNLLRLVTNLADLDDFHKLGLFTRLSAQRMNDVDFVSELVAQMQFGITDKKEKVDDLYEADITEAHFDQLRQEFIKVLGRLTLFNAIVPISKTRYRQKNDFYTLFGFLHKHSGIENEDLNYFYNLLIKIGPYIRPSQERCEPLMIYALNCVTQSNSKRARQDRLAFFESLLLNPTEDPNPVQEALLHFFKLTASSLVRRSGYTTLRWEDLRDPDQGELAI